MKPVMNNGFTIVETMLFLAITGLLIMGVLVGTGTSINIQRYRDSVTSLQSYLQKQYSNVANVTNDSILNTCNSVPGIPRGQSDCLILGEYVTFNPDEAPAPLRVKDVFGRCSDEAYSGDDITALTRCSIYASSTDKEIYDLEWDSSADKTDGNPMALSMLILRSPSSGIIRTLISNNTTSTIAAESISGILSETSPSLPYLNNAKICVDSNGLFTGVTMAVQIDSNATSANGIEIIGEGNGCQG